MPRRSGPARCLGPYPHGQGFRFIVRSNGRSAPSEVFPTREECETAKAKVEKRLTETAPKTIPTFAQAIADYGRELTGRRIKAASVDTIQRRLSTFFFSRLNKSILPFTVGTGRALLDDLSTRNSKLGRPYSGAWCRYALVDVRSFGRWLVERDHWKDSPVATLKYRGKVNRGKPKLTFDETKRFIAKAHEMADGGDLGGVIALTIAYLGLRASEAMCLTPRSLDAGGTRLVIFAGKSENSKRAIRIVAPLRPYLAALAVGKEPTEFLFPHVHAKLPYFPRYSVFRVCAAAGVPTICAHALRGMLVDAALTEGEILERVAATLGHTPKVSAAHYASPGRLEEDREQALTAFESVGQDAPNKDPDRDPDQK